MSKIEHDRPRHIAFRIEAASQVSRAACSDAFRMAAKAANWPDAERPKLTRYAFPHGAVRVPHQRQADAVMLVNGITVVHEKGKAVGVRMTTLGASGTLAALTSRLGILEGRES